MTAFESIDFFTDESLIEDPYPYFEFVRAQGPVWREPHHGVVVVCGYEEAVAVYRDPETFSSCNSVTGPIPGLPVEPEGDDISALIDEHRDRLPLHDLLVTFDPPEHTAHRSLLMRLLTPRRLKETEDFMWWLADRQLDELVPAGRCEFIGQYSRPYSMLVIADLLGVPRADHALFRRLLIGQTPGELGEVHGDANPLGSLEETFAAYIEDRRRRPREDVLSKLASATFPDGSTPEVTDVVHTATFLFAAGQETTARLLGTALMVLAERPELQDQLRGERALIPNFVEECLRIESPVKSDFRMARRTTSIAGVDVPAGTTVMLLNGAANRDPRRFEDPAEFRLDRPNAAEHIAFGRGIHSCPGGSLARIETRASLERIVDRMADIRLSEEHHGPRSARRFLYDPTYVLRGLTSLHLEFTPVEASG